MNLLTSSFVIPTMVIFAIVVLLVLGSIYNKHYDNFYTVLLPIMLALTVIPTLGVYGYSANNTILIIASVFCCFVTGIYMFFGVCNIIVTALALVAGLLAFVATLAVTGGTITKDWNTLFLFCNFFTYFQILCTGTLLLEGLKNGLHFHSA